MAELPVTGGFDLLRQVVSRSFPARADVANLNFDGTLAQAWPAFARLLAMDESELAKKIAPQFGIEAAGALDPVDPRALALVPSGFCQSHQILPLRLEANVLVVATYNPTDSNVSERLGFLADKRLRFVLAPPRDIDDAIVLAYGKEAERSAAADQGVKNIAIDEHSIVKLGRALMSSAIDQRASDLHIQPYLGSAVVRVRVDGALRRLTMLPDAVATTLIRHLKARSGMDPTNIQMPQDGRMSLVHQGRDFDMRVSSLPASRGERLVIRFLDQSRVNKLAGANFSLAALQTLRRAITRPSGMVIMTGPTGSGKTSTLYGMLAELNRGTVNIITVENPVEYRITGISQVEVNEKAGRTFHAALRSILRQDPDVVLIGEIRDAETAEIAAQAALTGHLVLSTLHTNDALTAIPRLLNLGLQPTILADALATIVAQRLCRSLCPHCKVPVVEPLTPEERSFAEITRNAPGGRPVGCKQCDYTGYRGRLPVVDIVEMNRGLRDAVALGESRLSELDKLRVGGLRSLAASGSLRVISGDTTVREVMEAVGPSFWPELAEHYGALAFTDTLDIDAGQGKEGLGVLLIGGDPALAAQLDPAVEAEGMHLVLAATPEQANEMLHADEDITFIIGDVPEDASLEAAADEMRRYRQAISWARLPAMVLLPPGLSAQENTLRESGVMAAFMPKPLDVAALVNHIRHAHAR